MTAPALLPDPELSSKPSSRRLDHLSSALYWLIHAACVLGYFVPASRTAAALCAGLFVLRMFAITGGYHRYFSHRSYRTSRTFQFLLGLVGTTAVQKGPLWWAAGHRRHHQFSDRAGDMHSPREGFRYAHYGWIFDAQWDRTQFERVRDLSRFPELIWLNRWHPVPAVLLALLCYAVAGWSGVVWGFLISTVLLWHATYSINSLAHLWGRQRYDTGDDSRNSFLLALLTMGEGWHNNHHHYMSCARQGFFWWEIDVTYYALRSLAALGLIWDLREPPAHVVEARQPARRSQRWDRGLAVDAKLGAEGEAAGNP